MINRYTVFLLMGALCGCDRVGEGGVVQWTYRPINSSEVEITIRPPDFFSFAHRGVDGSVCADDSPFYCFRTDSLSFAVPKHLADTTTAWEDGGVNYSVTVRRREIFFGQEFDAYFITGTRDGSTREFMFSPDRGLLSVIIREGELATQLVSIEYCGFGAPPTCAP